MGLNVTQITDRIVSSVLRLFRGLYSALYELDPLSGALVCVAAAGEDNPSTWIGWTLPPGAGLAGRAVAEGRPIWSADVCADPEIRLPEGTAARIREEGHPAAVAIPLAVQGEVRGALLLADTTGREFTEEDLEILSAFADQAALALENARLHAATLARIRALTALVEVNRALTRVVDYHGVARAVLGAAQTLLPDCAGDLWEVVPGTDTLRIVETMGVAARALPLHHLGEGLTGNVAATGAPVISPDLRHDDRLGHTDWAVNEGLVSGIGLPLRHAGAVYGTLGFYTRTPHVFSPEEVHLFEAFAAEAAAALAYARLYEAAEHGRREADVVAELDRTLNASLDLNTVLQRVADGARDLCGSDLAQIALLESGTQTLIHRYWAGAHAEEPHYPPIESGKGIGGQVLLTGRPFRTVHYAEDPRISKDYLDVAVKVEGIVTVLAVPIYIEGRIEGVLYVCNRSPRPFNDRDETILQRLADHAAIAIGNSQLFAREQAARAAAEASGQQVRELVQGLDAIVWEAEAEPIGLCTFVSQRIEAILGYPVEKWLGVPGFWLTCLHPDDRDRVLDARHSATLAGQEYFSVDYRMVATDGRAVWLRDHVYLVRDAEGRVRRLRGLKVDITAEKRAEAELQASEAQLRQAQKMEPIGRLAGGIAHDFNNLLTVIRGYSDLLSAELPPGELQQGAAEISKAADRAAALTRQLLAFSRRQVLQPRVLDLNTLVANVSVMLRRLIGEPIELVTVLGPALGRVRADPGQLEQVLVNLAVNARDAMTQGGRLTLETTNVELDEALDRQHGATPGSYVRLVVRDTGCGMDAETLAHLFEPFFTTKPPGQGSGLGLATVYGIVKQSGGSIQVASEPGHGTTVTIDLPRVEALVEEVEPGPPVTGPRGTETILVVEDEATVRELVCRVLQRHGYTVLEAADPEDALGVADRHPAPIHLLLTDVVMPRMSGWELAERLARRRPAMKVLFISGYTDDALGRHGVPAPGAVLLLKPFTPEVLTRRVRKVLDVNKG